MKHWKSIFLVFLLLSCLYLRLYGWDTYSQFGWDQVDNAWAAKNILVNHKVLLSGMVAKEDSGIYMGPLYYYAIAIFYFFTHLDPIASIIFAAVTSVFSAFVIFFVAKKLFSTQVAFVALFIQVVSLYTIIFDRVQWPVDFIPGLSLLILYFLYRVITGHEKSLLWLGIVTGLMFHIHFTAIYFPILILLSLPFFPRNKKTLMYGLFAILIFLIFLIPSVIVFLQNKSYGSTIANYGSSNYHGIHLVRILQLTYDAFIQYVQYLYFPLPSWVRLLFLPAFALIYWLGNKTKNSLKLIYLFVIWFLVPWIVLSAYSGELTDYYYASTRFVALLIVAFVFTWIFFARKNIFLQALGILTLLIYGFVNLKMYVTTPVYRPLSYDRKIVEEAIQHNEIIQFTEGDPTSYLYYIETRK